MPGAPALGRRLLPLLLALGGGGAQALERAAEAACAAAPALAAAPAVDHDSLLLLKPAQALARACARRAATPQAALEVAEAQLALGQLAPAEAMLEQLAAMPAALSPLAQARLDLARGQLLYEQSRHREARPLIAQALSALPAGVARLRAALKLAQVAHRLGGDAELAAAEQALQQAERMLADLGLADGLLRGELLNALTLIAFARHDYEAARRFTEEEIALTQRLGEADNPALIHSFINLAASCAQLERFEQAEQAYQAGLRLAERRPDADAYALQGLLRNYASFLIGRGRYLDSLALAERSLSLIEQRMAADSPYRVQALVARAEAELYLSRYAQAERTLQQAEALARRLGDELGRSWRMRLHEARAGAYTALGWTEQAAAALREGLAVDEPPQAAQRYWRARLQWRQAALHGRLRDWAAAERQLAEAEPVLSSVLGANSRFVLALRARRCQTQLALAQGDEACQRLQAMPAIDGLTPHDRYARDAALAELARRRGDAVTERGLRLSALAAAQHVDGADPLWLAWHELAGHLRRSGEREAAVLAGKQALRTLERLRLDIAADARRLEAGYLADKLEVYERLADWLSEDGRIDEALHTLRLLKREEFHDFLRRGSVGAQSAAELPHSRREREALARWQAAAGEGLAPWPAREASRLSGLEREQRRRQLALLAEREAEQVRAWQALLPGWLDEQDRRAWTPPPGLPPLRAARPGELRVWAYLGAAHLNLVFDGAGGRSLRRIAVDPAWLAQQIGQLLAAAAGREALQVHQQALLPLLARPLAEQARAQRARRLLLLPSGVLRYLPLAALEEGGQPLGARWAIEQRIAGGAGAESRALALQVQAFGLTQALNGQAALPAMAEELCAIVRGPLQGLGAGDTRCERPGAIAGQAWLNQAFSRDRLLQVLAAAPAPGALLHLGTHFSLRPAQLGRSWMQLGDGDRLSVDELAGLSFAGRGLVTLSACETGVGGADPRGGAELDGLNLVVLRGGAQAVLASLWRVEDQSTAVLMRHFYAALARGAEPALALQQAQQRLRGQARWAHPFHWAGFYLVRREPEGGS